MEEAPENGKELSHSAHANGMNEWMKCTNISHRICQDCFMKCKNFKRPPQPTIQAVQQPEGESSATEPGGSA